MKNLFLTILLFASAFSFAQNADSLKNILKTAKQDANRVDALSELAQVLAGNNPDTSLLLGNQALLLSQKLNYKIGEAWAEFRIGRTHHYFKQEHNEAMIHYNKALALCELVLSTKQKAEHSSAKKIKGRTLGGKANMCYQQADYLKALEYFFKGLKLSEEVGDKQQVGKTLGNIANVYLRQADYPKALEYYFKGLKLCEELGDKPSVSISLGNIGGVYFAQEDFPKALEYNFKGLKISEEIGDKQHVGVTLGFIANVYANQADYPKALEYYLKGLKLSEEVGDKQQVGRTLGNIAATYKEQADYPKALEYYLKGLKIAEEVGDKLQVGRISGNIGELYTDLGKYKEAEIHLKKALSISVEIGIGDVETDQHEFLSKLYEKTNRPALAFEHYKKYIALRDTIFSQENTKKLMRSEMDHQYEKEKLVTDAKHQKEIEKQNAIAEEKNRKQKVISLSVGVGLVLVLILALFIYRSNRQKQKANHIITLQKKEVESQKHLIEEKHKEITDSINYAERIQRSFLASKEMLDSNFNRNVTSSADKGGVSRSVHGESSRYEQSSTRTDSDYFVYFQPKEVVSGDFYWATKLISSSLSSRAESRDEKFVLVTADSTGHGVPGAIMSLLNITSLESAIKDGHTQPADILNTTRKTIIERLKKDGSEQGGKDGMDASLICFDFANNKFTYAAANNPVWVVRTVSSSVVENKRELIELKPDKMPIGKHDKDFEPFTQHQFEMQKGDIVYALTDGFPDQFGGPNGKKFKYKQLKELLISIAHEPMHEQKQILADALNTWKGGLEQVDDVCVIGVRV